MSWLTITSVTQKFDMIAGQSRLWVEVHKLSTRLARTEQRQQAQDQVCDAQVAALGYCPLPPNYPTWEE